MNRRLYFLFPEVEHARRVVEELEQAGVDKDHIHAMARPEIDLSSLPRATPQQKTDRVWFIERLFWNGNLAIFALALIGLLVSLYWSFSVWSVLAIVVMLVTVIAGERFAVKVPHAHLNEVQGALTRGEILLMVDIPKQRVAEVDDLVLHRHPEAGLGGVGWTIEALGT
jgi:hypothetical protein